MAQLDIGGAASGAVGGGATGFGIGGPVGGAAGALLGGVAGLFGKKKKKKKISTFDKAQQMLNQQQHESILGKGPLADLYNYDPNAANDVFDKTIGRPAYRNFQENVIPGITGAFRSEGLQNSSYAGDALSRAGRDVQESLDARRADYLYGEQNQARNAKRNAVENLQNRTTFDNVTQDPSGVNIKQILDSIPPQAMDALTQYFKSRKG